MPNLSPSELDALVVKRSADLAAADQTAVRQSFSGEAIKALTIEENTITVVASTVGTADDRSGDVIFPGAYKKSIAGFLKNGFVAIGHEWDELPVAMPTSCKEDGNDLVSSATFHSTSAAQDARTVCKERMDAGKSVSVSVGFMPDYSDADGVVWFDKGSDLLAWAKGKGFDISGFDVKGIGKLGSCRAITAIAEFFEWSIVGVGLNRGSKALAVKSAAERKSLSNTVSAILQAKIHQSFTVAADELAIRGYMDTPQRIELSGAISEGLKAFAAAIDEEVAAQVVDASDVDWVASKALTPEGKTFDEDFDETLGSLDSLIGRWEAIADSRKTLGETHRAKLASLLDRLTPIVAKSKPAPEPHAEDPDPIDDADEKAARFVALTHRTLSLRTDQMSTQNQ